MSEKVIKNKARAFYSRLNQQREPYQPEYERLNIEPTHCMGRSEFSMSTNRPVASGRYRKTAPKSRQHESPTFSPEHMPTSVSSDHVWNNVTGTVGEDESINNQMFNYDSVPYVPRTTVAPTEMEEPEVYQPKWLSDRPNDQQMLSSENSRIAEIESVADGEYCIIIHGDVIYQSSSIDDIEHVVEMILYENQSVTQDEISVFKKMRLKVGVCVSD